MYEIEIDNKTYTITQLMQKYEIKRSKIYWLLSKYSEKNLKEGLEKASRDSKGKYEYKGQMMTLNELTALSCISKNTLKQRLFRGWSVEDAIGRPYVKTKGCKVMNTFMLEGKLIDREKIDGGTILTVERGDVFHLKLLAFDDLKETVPEIGTDIKITGRFSGNQGVIAEHIEVKRCKNMIDVQKNEIKQKIYISGPITDNPDYKKQFVEKYRELESKYRVLTPLFINCELDWQEYMEIDLAMVRVADVIYMMKGWQNSKGCNIELKHAEMMGIPVIYEE